AAAPAASGRAHEDQLIPADSGKDEGVVSGEFLMAPTKMFCGGIKGYKNKICEVEVFGIRQYQIDGSTKKGDADV
ncbi:MAG: hypothetical protein ACRET1_03180, partial [Burkholderiales bacterium]